VRTLRGKRALVTGAARGIGRAIALALAREGVELYLVDIDGHGLEAAAREAKALGTRVQFDIRDLSIPAEISACTAACIATLNGLDILVNSAGVLRYGLHHELLTESWNMVLSINLLAPVQLVQELLPTLAAQKESHIVNVCSVVGLVPVRKLAIYQTSKFGLVGFPLALRTLGYRFNVGVTALCPSLVDTPMLEEMGPLWYKDTAKLGPLSPVVSAETVASHAIASIRRNKSIVVIPLSAKLLWWAYRLAPTLFVRAFSRQFRLRARR
jgi:3-oxoacyl-[acyl-carrier protein] reductase